MLMPMLLPIVSTPRGVRGPLRRTRIKTGRVWDDMITQHELNNMTDEELVQAQRNYMDMRFAGVLTTEDMNNEVRIMDEEDRRKAKAT